MARVANKKRLEGQRVGEMDERDSGVEIRVICLTGKVAALGK